MITCVIIVGLNVNNMDRNKLKILRQETTCKVLENIGVYFLLTSFKISVGFAPKMAATIFAGILELHPPHDLS
jgi:hypothetical protein